HPPATPHRLGIPTHCTMLYGHVETYEERVDHLLRLRGQQDRTGGFLAFIPLAFHPENTVFERRGWRHTTGADDLKLIAVSRLLLDNIPNLKAYWIMMGLPLAQVALHFGANDVQGTVVREEIFHAAGARTATEQRVPELVRFMRDAGRIPVQRDTLYNQLQRWASPAPRLYRLQLVMPIRRRIFTLVLATIVALVVAVLPASAGGGNNVVIVANTTDGATLASASTQVIPVPMDSVTSGNVAIAVNADCVGCHSSAVAVQILMVVGSPS